MGIIIPTHTGIIVLTYWAYSYCKTN